MTRGRSDRGVTMTAPTANNMNRIEHLVVLTMENRSFDHVLGSLRTEGRKDVDGIPVPPEARAATGGSSTTQAPITSPDANYTIPHGRATMLSQRGDGSFASFVSALQLEEPTLDPHLPMGY